MASLSVKVFDNELGQLRNVEPRIKHIFEKMGYEPIIDARVVDLDEHSEQFIATRPDVIICDNHFGDELGRQSLGFNFVSRYKPFYPDCLFVLMTQEQFTNNEFGKLFPHPDLVISKSFLISQNEKYEDFLISEFRRLIKRAKIKAIKKTPEMENAFKQLKSGGRKKRPITETEINSLVEQMCFMDRPGAENIIEFVELDEIGGGMSNSIVATVSLKGSSHKFNVPGVAKFSTRKSAEKEIENHSRYVKWTLPYTWRVDILGTGMTGEFGVVCYSFAHGGSIDPNSGTPVRPVALESLIKKGALEVVGQVISSVFDPHQQTWYAETRNLNRDLGAYISGARPYFVNTDDWDRKREVLFNVVRRISKTHDLYLIERRGTFIVKIGQYEVDFSNFINFLFARNWSVPIIECICHGDMHGGNIMVKPNTGDFAFIDFQHTGWHHRARDFCSLEGSIRTWFPRTDDVRNFSDYFFREIDWVLRQEDIIERNELRNDREVSGHIRNLFLKNFKGSNYTEYVIASIVHSIWMLSFANSWAESQQEILVAKILAEMIFLQTQI
jgi:hypothetical protein